MAPHPPHPSRRAGLGVAAPNPQRCPLAARPCVPLRSSCWTLTPPMIPPKARRTGEGTAARLVRKWWAGLDSNQRRRKPADLQSAPVGRLGTYPCDFDDEGALPLGSAGRQVKPHGVALQGERHRQEKEKEKDAAYRGASCLTPSSLDTGAARSRAIPAMRDQSCAPPPSSPAGCPSRRR